ncbi:TetR family transcriptional regulator [Streptomyces griseoloalbus]|uniref:TetR family transcriptional regulator n=1 Tax=Streptomyces griseoloalbus TaxID=67303 RepID=A0ABV3E8W6_9ACTN
MTSSPRAEATRTRIADAAKAEFAAHGIAGARVDRIAAQARTSKERVYAYFRSKEELYDFVARRELTVIVQAVQLDPTDLPGYAGRLFDYFLAHPEHFRLVSWGRLELETTAAREEADEQANPYRTALFHKADQLRRAQQDGYLDPRWDPVDVLVLVDQLATSWCGQPEFGQLAAQAAEDPSVEARRAAVVQAVHILFPPPATAAPA